MKGRNPSKIIVAEEKLNFDFPKFKISYILGVSFFLSSGGLIIDGSIK
jgi:hypothetical protein